MSDYPVGSNDVFGNYGGVPVIGSGRPPPQPVQTQGGKKVEPAKRGSQPASPKGVAPKEDAADAALERLRQMLNAAKQSTTPVPGQREGIQAAAGAVGQPQLPPWVTDPFQQKVMQTYQAAGFTPQSLHFFTGLANSGDKGAHALLTEKFGGIPSPEMTGFFAQAAQQKAQAAQQAAAIKTQQQQAGQPPAGTQQAAQNQQLGDYADKLQAMAGGGQ